MHQAMVCAGAERCHYALACDLRVVHASQIAAMVEWDFSYLGILVAFVGAISYLPIALPIPYAVFAADIDAKIDRFKDHIFGSNLRPDRVVEQAVVIEISLERRHARESFFLELLPKRTTLFIRHRLTVVGRDAPYLTMLSKFIIHPRWRNHIAWQRSPAGS